MDTIWWNVLVDKKWPKLKLISMCQQKQVLLNGINQNCNRRVGYMDDGTDFNPTLI